MSSVYQFQKLSADAFDMSMVSYLDKVNYSGKNWTFLFSTDRVRK